MVNLTSLGLMPDQTLNRLSYSDLLGLFNELWETITTYKGLYLKEDRAAKGVAMTVDRIHRKYDNLTVNDITVAIEKAMAYDEVTKLSPEFFVKIIQKANNEKRETEGKLEKKRNYGAMDSNWGKAVNIRLVHDPKGKIMDEQGFTLKDIYEAVLKGFNIYTNDTVIKNVNVPGSIGNIDMIAKE